MNYLLPIDNQLAGKIYILSDFPDLQLIYVSANLNEIMINVNGTGVLLKTQDLSDDRSHLVDDRYRLKVINSTPNDISFSIEEARVTRYNLNEPFTVNLDENPSTGYTWEVQVTPGLKIMKDTFSNQCQEGMLGCGGTRTFVLIGTKKGLQTFSAQYKRSWEKDAIYTRTYMYDIH